MDIRDRIINKAVDLWCERLRNPFVKLDERWDKTKELESKLKNALESNPLSDNQINIFRKELVESLKRVIEGRRLYISLSVDYELCQLLELAAAKAGISGFLFSPKSDVLINLETNRYGIISVSWGYDSPYVFYYPLDNGKWLVTSLEGNKKEMQKVFDSVVSGNPLGLKVEE